MGAVNERWAEWLASRMRMLGYPPEDRTGGRARLARDAGVPNPHISRWLNQGVTPDPATLRKLTGPLRATMLELLVAAGHMTPDEAQLRDVAEIVDTPEVIRRDPRLNEVARAHFLSQYDLLVQLGPSRSPTTTALLERVIETSTLTRDEKDQALAELRRQAGGDHASTA